MVFIAYIWRPTANNRRFAMSDELAQDDEGFEITDFGAEDEDDEDLENAAAHGNRPLPREPRYDPPPGANTARAIPRDSVDGETIFAVGDDGDRWSEEGSDDEEGKKLANKSA